MEVSNDVLVKSGAQLKSHVELSDEHSFAMLKQSRMECPTERREVPGRDSGV